MSAKEVLLATDKVSKIFNLKDGTRFTACNEVSISLHKGETLGLVGESGCGKSTFVRTIMGLHPATSGKILFKGEDITNLTGEKRREMAKHIQMIFQDPATAFNPKMRIKDIICEPLRNFERVSDKEAEARAVDLLRQVELAPEIALRYPHELSGGQRQRVGIARALILEPEIIICDEATSALDVSVQDSIAKLLAKIQREKGVSYIFICHDLALVSLISHRVMVMQKGNVVEELPGNKLQSCQHPYTKKLLASVFTVHR
ncbi:putative ABC transporter ATP-binding protein [Selenomonas ruminantium subsp. lactilytica TAM6421]|uniref:Putative ABC transporter ATP-binding protein n=1 Tax=Selenomonas ruminantium subsp. lactilytica (strain NBRC 103574 / TAM6421) TaxID=927704 RepID=I0GP10_SELRL|nr:dipeptide/oligopeptide/nickel ABC transporter ATP-binding protein [Selenomonas ruminantium]BAL82497.1 putative ABC transporter ATP-binding protein [Selenomonas ruminantium subsp. lactilytica TAM6421]